MLQAMELPGAAYPEWWGYAGGWPAYVSAQDFQLQRMPSGSGGGRDVARNPEDPWHGGKNREFTKAMNGDTKRLKWRT